MDISLQERARRAIEALKLDLEARREAPRVHDERVARAQREFDAGNYWRALHIASCGF